MFRTTTHCNRYEFLQIHLDTPITLPVANAAQKKSRYRFIINDRTSYHDWYKAYFDIKFKVIKTNNTDFAADDRIAPISDAASLISELKVHLEGKTFYDSTDTYRVTHIKNLLTKSLNYTNSIATNEFYYPDENRTTNIKKQTDDKTLNVDYNKGFHDRQRGIVEGREESAIIPLNKFSFFEGLGSNILPPAKVKLEIRLSDDNTALYKSDDVDDGKVIVTKLVLWVPRLDLNAEGMRLVTEKYLSPGTTWSYLRETVEESIPGRQVDRTWEITWDVTKPRHVFVYLQKADKDVNQKENVPILDTFNMGRARLDSARLEVGSNVYYPETEYSYDSISRIYRDVIEYSHKQDNKNAGLFLTRDRFENLYGMLYFNLTYNSGDIDPIQLILRYKLNETPDYDYKAFAIILSEQNVMTNMVGNEISFI